ncbi:hypothetical protein OsI_06105 [Oryza sativa Indica Group]|uniref:Uncharacterized protein n=1 Tax=Oryza sativa subsp. indica TaxID=39946 RepID=A2X1M5_ORYSI|nr:hypothetical protein OsI_06105 [Oryza sativa Indica Group]
MGRRRGGGGTSAGGGGGTEAAACKRQRSGCGRRRSGYRSSTVTVGVTSTREEGMGMGRVPVAVIVGRG